MPSSNLHTRLNDLASSFTDGVLHAIRSASLDELLAESGGGRSAPVGRRPRAGGGGGGGGAAAVVAAAASPKTKTTRSGRLARRSPEQIAEAIDQVVNLVKKSKAGLRSEEIRKQLSLDVREVPRILRTAVASKKLKSKGQKRATTYSAR
jgi:hypothetical protein